MPFKQDLTPVFENAIFGKHSMYSLFRKIFLITRKYGYLKIIVAKTSERCYRSRILHFVYKRATETSRSVKKSSIQVTTNKCRSLRSTHKQQQVLQLIIEHDTDAICGTESHVDYKYSSYKA